MFENLPTRCQCWECGHSPNGESTVTKIRNALEREAMNSDLKTRELAEEQLEKYFCEYEKAKEVIV